ncbi:MAG: cupin domain-containing protein [bacterium]|nr:cupin domain-containing protein [bacterium]
MPIRTDEDVKIVPKGWGEERWLHNDELYCGKILVVNEGKRCSLHYHQLKTETFYIQQGRVRMELTDLKAGRETPPVILEDFEMQAGDTLLLKPGMVHRFTSLEGDAHIFEFSTQHFDEDSHRIEKGD